MQLEDSDKLGQKKPSRTLRSQRITFWSPMIVYAFSPFKVIDFCSNRKPIYDFILVINIVIQTLISHCFQYSGAKSEINHPTLVEPFSNRNFLVKLTTLIVEVTCYLSVKTATPVILASFVLSKYICVTDRQTYCDNSRTLQSQRSAENRSNNDRAKCTCNTDKIPNICWHAIFSYYRFQNGIMILVKILKLQDISVLYLYTY